MKRIVSVLLSICMLWTINIYADNTTSATADEYAKAAAVLEYIGAYTAPQNITENDITRAEFSSIVAKIINAVETENNVYFSDVTRENIYVSQINALKEAGIVSGETLLFRPDDAITYAEAAKILLSVSGYDVYANAEGGFPMGYVHVAGRLKLLSGKSDASTLKHHEAIEMIYNAFSMGIYDIKSIDEEDGNLYVTSENTIFSICRNIYVGEGKLISTHTASSENITVGKAQVMIGGVLYDIDENIYADDLFLNTVEFAYEKRADNSKYIFYAASADTADNDDVIIESKDLTDFDSESYVFSYYSGDKQKSVSTARNTVVYYNGEEYTGSVSDAIAEFTHAKRKGSVRLKKSGQNSGYDILIIKSYRNVVVNQLGADADIIYNMADYDDKIEISSYDGVSVRAVNKNVTTLSITPPAVLQVAESKNKRFIEIIICSEKVNGTVSKITEKNGEKHVTIGEYEIKVDSTYVSTLPEFVVGSSYTVILDTFGYAAYVAATYNDGYTIGLLIDCIQQVEPFSKNIIFKVLENGGEAVKKIESAKRIKIDGTSYDLSEDDPFSAIPGANSELTGTNGNVEQQAIRYKLDEEGRIAELDTYFVGETEDDDNTLTKISAPLNFNRYMSRFSRLGTSVLRDSVNTITFAKPRMDKNGYLLAYEAASGYSYSDDAYVLDEAGNKVMADDTMYHNYYFIRNEEWAMLDVYKYNPNTHYADIIVHTYESFYASTDCFIFDEVGEALNEDGEVVPMLYCWNMAEHKGYEISSPDLVTSQGLQRGDLFRCAINPTTNDAKSIQRVYDCRNDVFYGTDGFKRELTVTGDTIQTTVPDYWYTGQWQINNISNKVTSFDYYKNFQLSKGAVLERIGKALFWDWDGDYSTYEESCDFTNIPLMIIDLTTDRNNIRSGQPEEIADYKSAGNNCSEMVLYNTYLTAKCGYVYIR